jgi:hypothetical protein
MVLSPGVERQMPGMLIATLVPGDVMLRKFMKIGL